MLQRTALEETKAVFPSLRERIKAAIEKLENELVRDTSTILTDSGSNVVQDAASGADGNADEITQAKETIAAAKARTS